jgi:hypothetical protein
VLVVCRWLCNCVWRQEERVYLLMFASPNLYVVKQIGHLDTPSYWSTHN